MVSRNVEKKENLSILRPVKDFANYTLRREESPLLALKSTVNSQIGVNWIQYTIFVKL